MASPTSALSLTAARFKFLEISQDEPRRSDDTIEATRDESSRQLSSFHENIRPLIVGTEETV